ncbi:MAG: hypothetical protein AAF393_10185 [Pseudomonadota bacterium]
MPRPPNTTDPEMTETNVGDALHMISLAGHQLRGPLRNIRVLLDLLQDTAAFNPDQVELFDAMRAMAHRAENAVGDVVTHCLTASDDHGATTFAFQDVVNHLLDTLDPDQIAYVEFPSAHVTCQKAVLAGLLQCLMKRCLTPLHPLARARIGLSAEDGMLNISLSSQDANLSAQEAQFLAGGSFKPGLSFGLISAREICRQKGGTITLANCSDGVELELTLPGSAEIEVST